MDEFERFFKAATKIHRIVVLGEGKNYVEFLVAVAQVAKAGDEISPIMERAKKEEIIPQLEAALWINLNASMGSLIAMMSMIGLEKSSGTPTLQRCLEGAKLAFGASLNAVGLYKEYDLR